MQRRTLGGQGLESSALGVGCMGMSEFWGSADAGQAVATAHRALEPGVTLLDTASSGADISANPSPIAARRRP